MVINKWSHVSRIIASENLLFEHGFKASKWVNGHLASTLWANRCKKSPLMQCWAWIWRSGVIALKHLKCNHINELIRRATDEGRGGIIKNTRTKNGDWTWDWIAAKIDINKRREVSWYRQKIWDPKLEITQFIYSYKKTTDLYSWQRQMRPEGIVRLVWPNLFGQKRRGPPWIPRSGEFTVNLRTFRFIWVRCWWNAMQWERLSYCT